MEDSFFQRARILYNPYMEKIPVEIHLGELLLKRHLSLAVAESCTGGLVGHLITNVPGSSQYFLGGVMVYSDEIKMKLLGVRQQTLQKQGAVSRETVQEMASGVRRLLAADIGAAISGIAGPGGGTTEKPVGLTWIGLSAPGLEAAWSYIMARRPAGSQGAICPPGAAPAG